MFLEYHDGGGLAQRNTIFISLDRKTVTLSKLNKNFNYNRFLYKKYFL